MYYMHVPSCKKSLALHLIILAVRHRLALTLAKLPQYLQIQAVIIEFLFHRRRICWQRYEIFLRFIAKETPISFLYGSLPHP